MMRDETKDKVFGRLLAELMPERREITEAPGRAPLSAKARALGWRIIPPASEEETE
jgi:hypothetical protein